MIIACGSSFFVLLIEPSSLCKKKSNWRVWGKKKILKFKFEKNYRLDIGRRGEGERGGGGGGGGGSTGAN